MNNFDKLLAIVNNGDWGTCGGIKQIYNQVSVWWHKNCDNLFSSNEELLIEILRDSRLTICTESKVIRAKVNNWLEIQEQTTEEVQITHTVQEVGPSSELVLDLEPTKEESAE